MSFPIPRTARGVAEEAYATWRGSQTRPLDVLPPHWTELDHKQQELLIFTVLHTASLALTAELIQ